MNTRSYRLVLHNRFQELGPGCGQQNIPQKPRIYWVAAHFGTAEVVRHILATSTLFSGGDHIEMCFIFGPDVTNGSGIVDYNGRERGTAASEHGARRWVLLLLSGVRLGGFVTTAKLSRGQPEPGIRDRKAWV